MGRTLILIGLLIAGAGLLMTLGLPIGRLPGDFTIRRGGDAPRDARSRLGAECGRQRECRGERNARE